MVETSRSLNWLCEKRERFSGSAIRVRAGFPFGRIRSYDWEVGSKHFNIKWPNFFSDSIPGTQSLSAVVIDLDTRKVVYEKSLNFDQALPQFKTQNGVLPNRDPLVKHSSPLLWAAALDLLFAQMKKGQGRAGKILAVSGSGQQHGSVCFNAKAVDALVNLNPKKSWLKISKAFSRARLRPSGWIARRQRNVPRSAKNSAASSSPRRAPARTRFERFTGPQIRKFYKTEPKAYDQTTSIALVSSFMASLLAGQNRTG